MKTYAPDEVLKPGDIFETLGAPGNSTPESPQSPTYLVRSFRDACMVVAELGGQNRDERIVHPADIPRLSEINKWQLNVRVEGGGIVFNPNRLKELRACIDDLRTANTIGAYTIQGAENGHFASYLNLPHMAPFGQIIYVIGRPGVIQPSFASFDLAKLGAIPEDSVKRGEDGNIRVYNMSGDARMTAQGVEPIRRVAEFMGLLMYPESYVGARFFPLNHNDHSVAHIRAYIPGEANRTHPRTFSNLAAAHSAAMKFYQSGERCE